MSEERSAAGLRAHEFVLSNLSPSAAQRRFGLGVVLVLLVVFVIVAGPLSGLPLSRVDAFIPCVYRKPHPALISVLAGEITCSCDRIPCFAKIIPCSVE